LAGVSMHSASGFAEGLGALGATFVPSLGTAADMGRSRDKGGAGGMRIMMSVSVTGVYGCELCALGCI
jgi:hypothetical protein